MKKLYYLFLLPLVMLMACNDDDFKPVEMTLTLSGVTQSDGEFYTIAGEEVTINSLQIKPIGGKNTTYQNVVFYLNNVPLVGNWVEPFTGSFSTENLPAGTYSLGVAGNLLQVDAPIQTFAVSYPLVIVDDPDELPSGAPAFGTYSATITIQQPDK